MVTTRDLLSSPGLGYQPPLMSHKDSPFTHVVKFSLMVYAFIFYHGCIRGGLPPHFFKNFITYFCLSVWLWNEYLSHYQPILDLHNKFYEFILPQTDFITWNVMYGKWWNWRNSTFFFIKISKSQNRQNFCKMHGNDFILGQKLYIDKRNNFWNLGENPTSWRHFMTDDVIFPYISLYDVIMTSAVLVTCTWVHIWTEVISK